MKSILVLNGPNLNLLGAREPETYGHTTLADIETGLHTLGTQLGVAVECFQTNHEGVMIERIHAARQGGSNAIVINPGAWTHTSIALRDALAGVGLPFVEVHISNVHRREAFRQHSYLSDLAAGVIVGCGVAGYGLALRFLVEGST